jgi:hypothetical protein
MCQVFPGSSTSHASCDSKYTGAQLDDHIFWRHGWKWRYDNEGFGSFVDIYRNGLQAHRLLDSGCRFPDLVVAGLIRSHLTTVLCATNAIADARVLIRMTLPLADLSQCVAEISPNPVPKVISISAVGTFVQSRAHL